MARATYLGVAAALHGLVHLGRVLRLLLLSLLLLLAAHAQHDLGPASALQVLADLKHHLLREPNLQTLVQLGHPALALALAFVCASVCAALRKPRAGPRGP